MRFIIAASLLLLTASPAHAQLLAAVLPSSRSVPVGQPATAFATIINAGSTTATGCRIAPATLVSATFDYQTTDPATNKPTGTANAPVDIAAGGSQSFVIAFTPTSPIDADIQLTFGCTNLPAAPITPGVNTFKLLACSGTVADYVSVAATPTNDGIVTISGATGTAAFSAAVTNVGPAQSAEGCFRTSTPPWVIRASTMYRVIPEATTDLVSTTVCLTDAAGNCEAPPTNDLLRFALSTGQVATFSVFVQSNGMVPFSPATNRVTLRFEEWARMHNIFCSFCPDTSVLIGPRGSTSVAVRTTP